MKLTLVVQRYGLDVVGGAERLCRGVAEGLSSAHDVEVLTTCARSYITWANHYEPGVESVNGVRVRRFPTQRERDIISFNKLSERLFAPPEAGRAKRTPEQEEDWIEQQGPYSPALVEHLGNLESMGKAPPHNHLLFFTYLYHPTVHGLRVAPERSILVPAAHDEAPIYIDAYESVFRTPRGLVFNTRAEERLVRQRFPGLTSATTVAGVGIDGLDRLNAAALDTAAAASTDPTTAPAAQFLLYAGRIEPGKGVVELLEYLARFRDHSRLQPILWLMGEQTMDLPNDDWIVPLGFVSEQEKAERLAQATLLVFPSALESFGIVPLEAMAARTPVLVNAASEAAVEHCTSANAGLYYRDYDEFAAALTLLLSDPQLRNSLADNGSRYVEQNFAWPAVAARYERFLTTLT